MDYGSPTLKNYNLFLKNGPTPASFVYFRSFQIQFYRTTVDFSGIQTQIFRVEGEHADHLTTTTAQELQTLTSCSNTKHVHAQKAVSFSVNAII